MKMEKLGIVLFVVFAVSVADFNRVASVTFTFANKCSYTVWAGTLKNSDKPALDRTGFQLDPNQGPITISAPAGWGGRMWGRTGCATGAGGRFTCTTADCGSGEVECNGAGGAPPATLIEFTLGVNGAQDTYDVSLVDGFNLPFGVVPEGGTGQCVAAACSKNVNDVCPSELSLRAADGATVGCRSACAVFNTDEYCCRGAFNTSDTCKPSHYSMIFKDACPQAYSYAYDDRTSTFTCTGAPSYLLTFCP